MDHLVGVELSRLELDDNLSASEAVRIAAGSDNHPAYRIWNADTAFTSRKGLFIIVEMQQNPLRPSADSKLQ